MEKRREDPNTLGVTAYNSKPDIEYLRPKSIREHWANLPIAGKIVTVLGILALIVGACQSFT